MKLYKLVVFWKFSESVLFIKRKMENLKRFMSSVPFSLTMNFFLIFIYGYCKLVSCCFCSSHFGASGSLIGIRATT